MNRYLPKQYHSLLHSTFTLVGMTTNHYSTVVPSLHRAGHSSTETWFDDLIDRSSSVMNVNSLKYWCRLKLLATATCSQERTVGGANTITIFGRHHSKRYTQVHISPNTKNLDHPHRPNPHPKAEVSFITYVRVTFS